MLLPHYLETELLLCFYSLLRLLLLLLLILLSSSQAAPSSGLPGTAASATEAWHKSRYSSSSTFNRSSPGMSWNILVLCSYSKRKPQCQSTWNVTAVTFAILRERIAAWRCWKSASWWLIGCEPFGASGESWGGELLLYDDDDAYIIYVMWSAQRKKINVSLHNVRGSWRWDHVELHDGKCSLRCFLCMDHLNIGINHEPLLWLCLVCPNVSH